VFSRQTNEPEIRFHFDKSFGGLYLDARDSWMEGSKQRRILCKAQTPGIQNSKDRNRIKYKSESME
jgi:hypothetical protein